MTSYTRPLSYYHARNSLRSLAQEIGADCQSYPLVSPSSGLDSDLDAGIDVISLRSRQAHRSLLLVTSGVHGVEGYAGSALQRELLLYIRDRLVGPIPVDICLVHALNPYGYIKHRRWNEQNIDLNRNFRVAAHDYTFDNDAYFRLNRFINPSTRPGALDTFWWQGPLMLLRYGYKSLNQAIAGGQSQFPQGLFFAGQSGSASKLWVDDVLVPMLKNAEQVLHFDLHTGLGAYGEVSLLLESPLTTERLGAMQQALQTHVVDSQKFFFKAPGNLGAYLSSLLPGRMHSVTLELGTFSPPTLFRRLRLENQAHHTLGFDAPFTKAAREMVLESFAPKDPKWWSQTMPAATTIIAKGMKARFWHEPIPA